MVIYFSQQTFLRHFCLYEFAFKPRVDLILRTEPIMNLKLNSKLTSLTGMIEVDLNEIKTFKAMLGHTSHEDVTSEHVREELKSQMSSKSPAAFSALESPHADISRPQESQVDWSKVGKVYQPNTNLEEVVNKEMGRLNRAFEEKLAFQDEKMLST